MLVLLVVLVPGDLVKARVAAHNQLRAHLQLAHPGVVGLFDQLDGKISLAFLTRFPTPPRPPALRETPGCRPPTTPGPTPAPRPSCSTTSGTHPPGCPDGPAADAAQIITEELIALLRSLRERITTLETSNNHALAAHADQAIFTSLPRSGSVRAATMVTEIGDARGRYPTDEALAGAAGIAPSTRASGRSHYVVFRRGCNHRLRQALVDFADGSRQANPWAQDVYARAPARGHNHAHAVRVLARAWLRIIWRCRQDVTPYDPARHLAAVAGRHPHTGTPDPTSVAS